MALPSSGQISLNQVNVELGNSGTAQIDMNSSAVRGLFDISSGEIEMADGYGKSNIAVEYITTKASSESNSTSTSFTMPTGIQAGDILVMAQATSVNSTTGFPGPQDGYGSGFTKAPSGQAGGTTRQLLYTAYAPTFYGITDILISYKLASSSDSGATISGFQASNAYGGSDSCTTKRQLFVFRQSNSGTLTALQAHAGQYNTPNSVSASISPNTNTAHAGVVVYISSGSSQSATLSGASYDTTIATSGGATTTATLFFGAWTADPGVGTVSITAPSSSSNANALTISSYGKV